MVERKKDAIPFGGSAFLMEKYIIGLLEQLRATTTNLDCLGIRAVQIMSVTVGTPPGYKVAIA